MAEQNKVDNDPTETQEWLDAYQSVLEHNGSQRAHFLLEQLLNKARQSGINLPYKATTAYVNSIPVDNEPAYPGDLTLERRLNAALRWNAMAMVVRGGQREPELGGHIASYASALNLYEVGFNHFFHGPTEDNPGDLIYIQGHSAPGIYARALLEGRLNVEQLDHFRQEVEVDGLSSYPHSWLMPDFWQFATVSMGLGPLQGIYQARFLKYLQNRELTLNKDRKVWVFCGDGEMDEPESLGGLNIASREQLDNLIFVINCNLQRLDGPVRGNGKIIQDLEGIFRGAGWNVIKVVWAHEWDALLAKDTHGTLRQCMEETLDGEYQSFKAKAGAWGREHFFGKYPELKAMVANMSDDEIAHLNFGGHDSRKVYAAYKAAVENTTGKPTVILAKTIKGYGMGPIGQGQNTTHQQKKMYEKDLQEFIQRFNLPIPLEQAGSAPYYIPANDSPEIQYLQAKRKALGGYLPSRRQEPTTRLEVPVLADFAQFTQGTKDREISTTMAFVRILNHMLKDKRINSRIVPIIPDECRTFGMEGMFRQLGIYSPDGQLYTPVDADQLMYFHEDKKGQILDEGITEAGGFCSWMAAGTSYSNNNFPMIPFYIFYSMFGFQRIGDLAWAAGDMRTQGFLLGGTSGRTTLAGEGLQHQDGQSLVMAGLIPNCVSYDPTYSYELAVIIQDGLRRMYQEQEPVYYYITIMNENYSHPDMPEGTEEGIVKGMYLLQSSDKKTKHRVSLLGSGTILREVLKAAEILLKDYGIGSDVWSVTSFNELRKEAVAKERWNRLHPNEPQKQAYVSQCFQDKQGPVIAATDYVRAYADQIRAYIPSPYVVLGTDGFGRSDSRERLRHFFEVDSKNIVIASLQSLVEKELLPVETLTKALKTFKMDPEKPDPQTV